MAKFEEEDQQNFRSEKLAQYQQQLADDKIQKIESMKGLLIETINILYKEHNITSLYHFRRRVGEAVTEEEILLAAEMMKVISAYR